MSEKDIILCIIVFIKNILVLVCFTFLAIFFEKWWIVFFAIIFWNSVSTKKGDE